MKRKLIVIMSALCVLALAGCTNAVWTVESPYGNASSKGGIITYTPPARPIIIPINRDK